jgi:excisionase family DNA binding protein
LTSKRKGNQRASANPKRPYTSARGPLLTADEAADYLGCTERQIRRLVTERRELPAVYVGKLLRLHKEDLDAYIADRRRVAGSR